MRKRVCIDISSTLLLVSRGYLSGIGRTTYELISQFDKMKNELPFDIVLFSQNTKHISSLNLGLGLASKHLNLPNRKWIDSLLSQFRVKNLFCPSNLWHVPHNFGITDNLESTIFTLHDMLMYTRLDEFPHGAYKKAYKTVPPAMRKCKGILTCSNSTKNDIVQYMPVNPDKVQVVYWGVNHAIFYPRDIESSQSYLKDKYQIERPYFFSVSCNYKRKNTPQLIESYLKLLKNMPLNDLVIIWNDFGEDIKSMIESSGGRIHVLNNIDDNDLAKLYSCATASFYPSSYEGFGLPVLESMACGTPCVTCNNSSLSEVGGDAAIYINSANEILTAMVELESGQYDLVSLRERGITHASQFTWERCAKETIDFYKKCLYE